MVCTPWSWQSTFTIKTNTSDVVSSAFINYYRICFKSNTLMSWHITTKRHVKCIKILNGLLELILTIVNIIPLFESSSFYFVNNKNINPKGTEHSVFVLRYSLFKTTY